MSGKRKHKHEEHVNHERWLISYADFITLLFAFFVVMYAVSSLNEGKYKQLSASMQAAFEGNPKTIHPIQTGEIDQTYSTLFLENADHSPESTQQDDSGNTDPYGNDIQAETGSETGGFSYAVKHALSPYIEDKKIKIRETSTQIEIEFCAVTIFAEASAVLSLKTDQLLMPIADVLSRYNAPIQIEGFADTKEQDLDLYPSRWELSAARSAAVARRFIALGLDPTRLSVVGRAHYFLLQTTRQRRGDGRIVVSRWCCLKTNGAHA